MARRKTRKKDDGILELLLNAPWQGGVIFTAFIFAFLRWFIPSQLSHNQILLPLGNLSKNLAPLTLLLLIPVLLAYFKQKKAALQPSCRKIKCQG